MPSIKKVRIGLLYKERFDGSTSIWQMFPNDSNLEIDNGFKLKASSKRVMLLTELFKDDFVFQAKVNHEPLTSSSFAGVILFKDNESWVECQTYWNTEKEENLEDIIYYSYIKLLKKDNMYVFYASIDGLSWDIVGTTRINDVNLIGFFFEPNDYYYEQIYFVSDIYFYSSSFLGITGLRRGDNISLYDGTTLKSSKTAVDNLNDVMLPLISELMPIDNLRIRIEDAYGALIIEDNITDIYTGDIYKLELNIDFVLIDSVTGEEIILDSGSAYDFGHLIGDMTYIQLYVINNDLNYMPKDFAISVEEYSAYYKGPKQIKLALSEYQDQIVYEDSFEWKEKIVIPQLQYNKKFFMVMKIEKDKSGIAAFMTTEYRYKIVMG